MKDQGNGEPGQIRHQLNRYQLTDKGLYSSAYAVTMTSLHARQ